VARLYAGLLHAFVVDEADAGLAAPIRDELNMEVVVLPTMMRTDADRARLAGDLMAMVPSRG
jgi:hypothetical protein